MKLIDEVTQEQLNNSNTNRQYAIETLCPSDFNLEDHANKGTVTLHDKIGDTIGCGKDLETAITCVN